MQNHINPSESSLTGRLKLFLNPFDGRYEDIKKGNVFFNVAREFTAGLVVAMVAIPMAMGFAMASGLKPEQGIVGGAIAGLIGALFGGSKYQVYGPTAAFIPIIAAMMALYPEHADGHAFLILCSIVAGIVLIVMGLAKLGRIVAMVPFSIVVGFTIGIAVVIIMSQIEAALGLPSNGGYQSFGNKISSIGSQFGEISLYAVILTLITFLITKYLLKISKFIPAPLIAIGVGILLSATIWKDVNLTTVFDKYGNIPVRFDFTPPAALSFDLIFLYNLFYFSTAIVFVAAIESLLCSRMADRLANNQGLPYRPNKELWGQGWVNIITPLLNGFPHTGALARTATNIEVGGQSPLAGIFKFITKLAMAAYLAIYLEMVPIACIAGILLYVASAMIKAKDIREVMAKNRFEVFIMVLTAIMVVVTDFLMGVLTGIVVYFIVARFIPNVVEENPFVKSKKKHITETVKEEEIV